jgi:hypothetical protein
MKKTLMTLSIILFVNVALWAQECNPKCPEAIRVQHVAGGVSPITVAITYPTVEHEGYCVLAWNLGATKGPDSRTDASDAASGWFWQFNRKQGYQMTGTVRTPNTSWKTAYNKNISWTSDNDPCTLFLGSGWRIPTQNDWNVMENWTSGIAQWNSVLKMSQIGYLNGTSASRTRRTERAYYWSSTQGLYFYFFDYQTSRVEAAGDDGAFPIRCCRKL